MLRAYADKRVLTQLQRAYNGTVRRGPNIGLSESATHEPNYIAGDKTDLLDILKDVAMFEPGRNHAETSRKEFSIDPVELEYMRMIE